MDTFENFNLLPSIKLALKKKGYSTPTPIQKQAIPHLIDGQDVLGIAQTGTGKTAAFALPLINRLAINKVKVRPARVRSLILTPTRELASQIESNIKEYGSGENIKSFVVFGGVGYRQQIQALSKGLDILVATPGRLLDLMNDGHVIYEQLEVFILDEADRMLDMGFIRDIRKIIAKLPKIKQTLLFSATMPKSISTLASSLLTNPIRVEVTPQATTVEKIDQKINFVEKSNKPSLLKSILKDSSFTSVLVFTKTKHGANKVVRFLERSNISCAAIHGNKSQGARERALNNFRAGDIRVLVATDIAARGIDVKNIGHVINYNLPDVPESYVHRIGRTARAGREGIAISFCDESEMKLLKSIQKFIRYNIPVDETHEFHGVAPQANNSEDNKGNHSSSNSNHKNKKYNSKERKFSKKRR